MLRNYNNLHVWLVKIRHLFIIRNDSMNFNIGLTFTVVYLHNNYSKDV